MKDEDFYLWIKNKCYWSNWDRVRLIYTALAPVKRHLPNLKEFLIFMFDKDTGYIPKWLENGTEDEFINEIENFTRLYSDTEKAVTTLVLKTCFADIGVSVNDGHEESRRKVYYALWYHFAMKIQEYGNLPFEITRQPFDKNLPGLGWSIEQKQEQNQQKEEKQLKIGAKHYALTYFLDCKVTGNKKYENQSQQETEAELYKFCDNKKSGNTIRKYLDEIRLDEIKNEKNIFEKIEYYGGINWVEIVLSLSHFPDELKKLLKDKGLLS